MLEVLVSLTVFEGVLVRNPLSVLSQVLHNLDYAALRRFPSKRTALLRALRKELADQFGVPVENVTESFTGVYMLCSVLKSSVERVSNVSVYLRLSQAQQSVLRSIFNSFCTV